jgi:peptidyl-prolyl cis-trans isomerase C
MLDDTRAKSPPPFEQLKMSLRSQAEQESLDKMLAGMKSAAKIEIVAKDMPSTPVSAAPPGPSMPVPGGAGPAALVMPPAASAMPAPSKPAGPSAAAPAAAKGN